MRRWCKKHLNRTNLMFVFVFLAFFNMKLRSKARRVVIVIKRERQWEDSIKLQTTHQLWTSYQKPTSTVMNGTALNIKAEDFKNYISVSNVKQEE